MTHKAKSKWLREGFKYRRKNPQETDTLDDWVKWVERWFPGKARDIDDKLQELRQQIIGDDYTPAPRHVLRFMEADPEKIDVVVLGQDPYPAPGSATGRAFEVGYAEGGLTRQLATLGTEGGSLLNILYVIARNACGPSRPPLATRKKDKINLVASKMNAFAAIVDFFDAMERKGVLFLNTALTCGNNQKGSHGTLWNQPINKESPATSATFATLVLRRVEEAKRPSEKRPLYLIWDDKAEKAMNKAFPPGLKTNAALHRDRVFRATHPSPISWIRKDAKAPMFAGTDGFAMVERALGKKRFWTTV